MNRKNNFETIVKERSENAIKEAIMARKKALEKDCASSLEKSMEASKMSEILKQKLNIMEAEER